MSLASEGTKVYRGDGEDPEDFNLMGFVSGVTGLGGGQTTINDPTTLLDSFRRKSPGLRDEGQASLQLQWVGTDDEFQGMFEDRRNNTLRSFKVEMPDDTEFKFKGFVLTFEVPINTDELVVVDCTIEIDGEIDVTWAGE